MAVLLCLNTGCATQTRYNPAFPLTQAEARADLARMDVSPIPLERPLIILCGWLDPGLAGTDLRRKFTRWTRDDRIASVSFNAAASMDECRKRVIETVEQRFPSEDDNWTAEVDVVAVSMGGLIARHAAAGPADATSLKRLNIVRLFTICTPHQGARRASLPPLNRQMADMRKGSAYIAYLDSALKQATFSIYPYGRHGDLIVGLENTAPPGETPYWVPAIPLTPSHSASFQDPRILADIARRLRGEPPFTAPEPVAPWNE